MLKEGRERKDGKGLRWREAWKGSRKVLRVEERRKLGCIKRKMGGCRALEMKEGNKGRRDGGWQAGSCGRGQKASE